ncbi:MAG TPA: glutaredoxin domain-containing protein [Polyangiaceae bacterium]|nr:glutaredoxin domain-containing protein [Polyangiaceae bacterium]
MRTSWSKVLSFAAFAFVLSTSAACKRAPLHVGLDAQAQLPVVRSESEGLLLTWIDDKGDFHVETRVVDVPIMGRDAVRVVDPNKDDLAHGDVVTIVDLRQARSDGAYPVRTMARTEFEAIAVARREQAGPTLASAAPEQPPPNAGSATTPSAAASPKAAASRGVVVIYGAEWCGACHDAARYLRRKGIAYVEKDIETDPAAAKEMQQKLAKSGIRGGSIPVIDVRGKLMVGFNPGQLDAALGEAL